MRRPRASSSSAPIGSGSSDAVAPDARAESRAGASRTRKIRSGFVEHSRPAESGSSPFEGIEPRSGVDYALRTIQQNQVHFSAMADNKASIMITVCSIVISASLTQLDHPLLRVPLLTLDAFTAIALICALLCAMPARRVPRMDGGEVDVGSSAFNPFFFMHFQHLSLEAFERELAARMLDGGSLYRTLARDIYAQGTVLARRKFWYLRLSYFAFIVGLLTTALVALAQRLASRA